MYFIMHLCEGTSMHSLVERSDLQKNMCQQFDCNNANLKSQGSFFKIYLLLGVHNIYMYHTNDLCEYTDILNGDKL